MSSSDSTSSPSNYRIVGILLAIGSGVFIGSSFILKKKGLLSSQKKGHVAGEGVPYLKSPLWWSGMTIMILGELLNLGAYSFVEAIIVTPMGALSVVICAILSHFFLKEKLTLFGWIGCFQCIMGSVIIALNAPSEQSVTTIAAFKSYFLAPWFLAYGGVVLLAAFTIIFFVAPKYGKNSMIWYILVCSLFGGLSVSCTQALGACIVTSIRGDGNQFKNWFIYFLLAFVICTLVSEIVFLNKALALFNTAMVTPTYYVIFTFFTLVTSVILYQGLKSTAEQILTMVLAFFVICSGIFILQMSKVDPRKLNEAIVDKKTSLLLTVTRQEVQIDREKGPLDDPSRDLEEVDDEKIVQATEEPGVDALRGTLGLGAIGSVYRARRHQQLTDRAESLRSASRTGAFSPTDGLSSRPEGVHRTTTNGFFGRRPKSNERAKHVPITPLPSAPMQLPPQVPQLPMLGPVAVPQTSVPDDPPPPIAVPPTSLTEDTLAPITVAPTTLPGNSPPPFEGEPPISHEKLESIAEG